MKNALHINPFHVLWQLKVVRIFVSIATALAFLLPAQAQFTEAAQIKPILQATQSRWIGVREWQGEDLIYFTHLEAFRCGIKSVHYGLNGDAPLVTYTLDECFTDRANPNEIDAVNHPPYVHYPLKSVEAVNIKIELKDGTLLEASYERAQIKTP